MRRVESRGHAVALGLMLGALLAPAPARAACTVSTTGVAFGAYNPQSATADDSGGTINVDCHPSDHSVEVEIGAGLSGSFATRRMSSGADTLNYNLYTNAGRTLVWGDGTGGSITQTLTGGSVSGGTRRFSATVYGRIPALQNVSAGAYNDTLILTVTF
jgi:spore coat protein U-like protein